jgi:hypothetical protein
MKKQIFILLMAIFAFSFSSAFGQPGNAINGSAPRGISCVDNAKHPMAGKSYTYTAASNQAGNFTFWATKDPNFITTVAGPPVVTTTNIATKLLTTPVAPATTPDLLATSANYGNAAAQATVDITWSDKIIAATDSATSPTFVAVLKDGSCVNNFDAWMIQPIKAFTVDIRNMNHTTIAPLAFDVKDNQCFDAVKGATWSAGQMHYDFGTQVLYFEVIAANFTSSYTPSFKISGLGNGQTATLEWDVVNTFASATAPVAITNATPITSAVPVTTALTSTTAGVSIYVRVTIKNNTYEGTLVPVTPITLAVDAQNAVGDYDIDNGNGTSCTPVTGAPEIGRAHV